MLRQTSACTLLFLILVAAMACGDKQSSFAPSSVIANPGSLAAGSGAAQAGRPEGTMSSLGAGIGAAAGAEMLMEVDGSISGLTGVCPALTFMVTGTTVTTSGATVFDDLACLSLQDGLEVEVKGTMSDGVLTATEVEPTTVTLLGNVTGLTGICPTVSFSIGIAPVTTDVATSLTGGSCTDLMDDVIVLVEGTSLNGTVLASIVELQLDDGTTGGPTQTSSASIEGTLTAIAGTEPNLTLVVAQTLVRTDSQTRVKRRGDTLPFNLLTTGLNVHVVGTRQPDSSIDARKVDIKDSVGMRAIDVDGAIAALTGICPAVQFSAGGYPIATDTTTKFKGGACETLVDSSTVRVDGLLLFDGSVFATKVDSKARGNGKEKKHDDDSEDNDSGDDDSKDDKSKDDKSKDDKSKDDKSKDDKSKDDKSKDDKSNGKGKGKKK